MSTRPVSYLQTDPRWAGLAYAAKGETATIGGSGCGPTAMAMVLATWADPNVTPRTECAWAQKNGYKAPGQGTYYGYFVPAARRYGLDCTQLNWVSLYGQEDSPLHAVARAAVDRGDLIIACMGRGNWTRSGHFVLLWQVEGEVAHINDPASVSAARTRGSWALFRQQVKYYFHIRRPAAVSEKESDMTEEKARELIAGALAAERQNLVKAVLAELPPVYDSLDQVPEWGRETVRRLTDRGLLQGTGKGLALSQDLLRMLVIWERSAA